MKLNFLDKHLLNTIWNEDISLHEVMSAFDIRTRIAFNLPSSIYGFVYISKKGHYHLILNGNINYETQCSVFLHEIKHIVYDMPTIGYIIGLDMQHEEFELITIY